MLANPGAVVAITGATGFIGVQLCAHLLQRGWSIRALVRNPDKTETLTKLGATLVVGDLANPAALSKLIHGADALVHCAGSVRGRSQSDFDVANVNGTANLVSCLETSYSSLRTVILSSIVAREPHLSWYSNSKYRAEQLFEDSGLRNWSILRPPAVYGPGDKEMLPIFQWMKRGIATVPGDPGNRTSLIHVDDLVAAITGLVEADKPSLKPLHICDKDDGYDWQEFAMLAGQVWQRRVKLLRIPRPLLNTIATCNLLFSRVLRYSPMLTPAKVRELRHNNWVADNHELQSIIDWKPGITLEKGLRDLAL